MNEIAVQQLSNSKPTCLFYTQVLVVAILNSTTSWCSCNVFTLLYIPNNKINRANAK